MNENVLAIVASAAALAVLRVRVADLGPGSMFVAGRTKLVVALASGSLALSHFNDGGFWFVKEYFGLTVAQTFRTWTLMITLASVFALGLVLILHTFI